MVEAAVIASTPTLKISVFSALPTIGSIERISATAKKIEEIFLKCIYYSSGVTKTFYKLLV